MLSLKFVLKFCHGIAKGGDYKVEFIQSFCLFYSVSNLLVIQHLETLYLGRNHVRVVYEKVWRKLKSVQSRRALQLDLATSKLPKWHTYEEGGAEGSHQLLHYRTKPPVWQGS